MAFREQDWLPSYEELKVDEINMTAPALRAGAHYFGKYCDLQCKEYMLCNAEEKDPRKCLSEGKEVTRCGLEFFRKVKKHCASEFTQYWTCLDHSGYDMNYKNCRKPQGAYDKCMLENLSLERPERGYFSKIRVHDSIRAKPKREVQLPEEAPREPAITSARAKELLEKHKELANIK